MNLPSVCRLGANLPSVRRPGRAADMRAEKVARARWAAGRRLSLAAEADSADGVHACTDDTWTARSAGRHGPAGHLLWASLSK